MILSTIGTDCYRWNTRNWKGVAPTNSVSTRCGLSICLPCQGNVFKINRVS